MKRCTGCGYRGDLSIAAYNMELALCWVCYRLHVSAEAQLNFERLAGRWAEMEEPKP